MRKQPRGQNTWDNSVRAIRALVLSIRTDSQSKLSEKFLNVKDHTTNKHLIMNTMGI